MVVEAEAHLASISRYLTFTEKIVMQHKVGQAHRRGASGTKTFSHSSRTSSPPKRHERKTDHVSCSTSSGPGLDPAQTAHRTPGARSIVLLIAMFMSLLDTTIVNVALQTIRENVNGAGHPAASEDVLSWIISGYALAYGIALIPAGRLGDRFGHKWVFFSGLAVFTAASLACGLAQSDSQLIMFRVIQGLAAGTFTPAVTAYIQILFQGKVRGHGFRDHGRGHRCLERARSDRRRPHHPGVRKHERMASHLRRQHPDRRRRADSRGASSCPGRRRLSEIDRVRPQRAPRKAGWTGSDSCCSPAASTAILVPLIEGQQKGWPLWTYLTLAGGVVLIVLFALYEVWYTKRGQQPARAAAPVQPSGVLGWHHPRARLLRRVHEHLLHDLAALAGGARPHRSRVRPRLGAIRDRLDHRLVAEQPPRPAAWPHRSGDRNTALVLLGLMAVWLILSNVKAADLNQLAAARAAVLRADSATDCSSHRTPSSSSRRSTPAEAGAASGVISTMQRVGSAIGIAVIGSVLFGVADLSSISGETKKKVTAEVSKKVAAYLKTQHFTSAAGGGAGAKDGGGTVRQGRRSGIGKSELAVHFTNAASAAIGVSAIFALVAFVLVFSLPRRLQQWGAAPGGGH